MKKRTPLYLAILGAFVLIFVEIARYSYINRSLMRQENVSHLQASYAQVARTFALFAERNWKLLDEWDSDLPNQFYNLTSEEAWSVIRDKAARWQYSELYMFNQNGEYSSVSGRHGISPHKETFKEGNYAITKTEGTLTIAKRSVLITSQSATKTYDGSALTRPAVTITGDGFVPGELAKAEATGSITKVGSTPNAIRYTTTGAFNAANYSIALSVGTLTVTEKPKPEPRRTFNLTISYVYQNGKRAAASYNRGGLKNGETFDITSPVIAGYTASETVVSGTIYNRDIKVTVIYTADGVNLDDYGVPLGLGNITMNVGDCFE